MQNYKDLIVLKKAHELVLYIYRLTAAIEQFGMMSQLRRAAVSIPSNIAEGCGKYTNAGFANFLQTALGSSNEVEYLSYLSRELRYLDDSSSRDAQLRINEIKAILITLIVKIRRKRK